MLCCNMAKKQPDPRTTDTERDWADAGQPMGSPNDPDIGKAHNQTTGPGGKGLRLPPESPGQAEAPGKSEAPE
jgi:hypothetical protein